jgi:adenylosuccinate synthase
MPFVFWMIFRIIWENYNLREIIMKNSVLITVGLGFGDEGKGGTVDYYARKYGASTVVRYGGGSQAAHNVVLSNGLEHCFAQFGSGTLNPGTLTFLAEPMAVNPLNLLNENEVLKEKGVNDALARLTIHPNCLVTTPFHSIHNQMLELFRGENRHGSCGLGVGQTFIDSAVFGDYSLRVSDLRDEKLTFKKLEMLRLTKLDIAEQLIKTQPENKALADLAEKLQRKDFARRLAEDYRVFTGQVNIADQLPRTARNGLIIFEGSQGILLDKNYGFWPYVTKADVSLTAAKSVAERLCPEREIVTLGIIRAYFTRHGRGPFVSEDAGLTAELPDKHNLSGAWQGEFRVGWFDLVAARYALEVCGGVDYLAITNLDRLSKFKQVKICTGYEYFGQESLDDLADCELIDGRRIITSLRKENFGHRESLTKVFESCRPVYEVIDFEPVNYLKRLEHELRTPIALVSTGSTSAQKEELLGIF